MATAGKGSEAVIRTCHWGSSAWDCPHRVTHLPILRAWLPVHLTDPVSYRSSSHRMPPLLPVNRGSLKSDPYQVSYPESGYTIKHYKHLQKRPLKGRI